METYNALLKQSGEYGEVSKIHLPLIELQGLPGVFPGELLVSKTGEWAQVWSLDETGVQALLFSSVAPPMGMHFTRTGEKLSVPIYPSLMGQMVNPLGENMGGETPKNIKKYPLEEPLPHISERVSIKKRLTTGVTIVDILTPLGVGQKELIIGDRKTGKTALLMRIAASQINEGALVIYAAIGRKQSELSRLIDFFAEPSLKKRSLLVATRADDPSGLIYLTPYSAMAYARYFRKLGEHVVVILDDLSTHAKRYREIALLAHSFPGRESYPGDIFYSHARLMEEAGNFKQGEKGEAAISCFPVVETVEGDLSGYIATNIMGMTDGHIYLSSQLYYEGRRPAIDTNLSVTRVGKQTQSTLQKEMGQVLSTFMTEYEKYLNYSHFGSELTPEVSDVLKKGELFISLFNQNLREHVSEEAHMVLFGLIWGTIISTKEELQKSMSVVPSLAPSLSLSKITTVEELVNKLKQSKELLNKIAK